MTTPARYERLYSVLCHALENLCVFFSKKKKSYFFGSHCGSKF